MPKWCDQGETELLESFFQNHANLYLGLFKNNTEGRAKWAASTAYNVGDLVEPTTPNGFVYECTVAGTSGSSEPTWPTTIDDTVVDGGVTWKCLRKCEPGEEARMAGMSAWQASTAYGQDDLVRPTSANGFYYRCSAAGTSGSTEPTWPTVKGQTVVDGSVTWVCEGVLIDEEDGQGYSRIELSKLNWTVEGDLASHPEVTFECTDPSGWGDVVGYFLATTNDETGRLLGVETFSDGPYNVQNVGDLVKITPKVRAD